MHCKDFEIVLESKGLGPLSADAREHLAACVNCQDLLADLDSIVATAQSLPAEVTPPDRIWISLRAQLEAEGIIKEPAAVPESSVWWESMRAWFQPRSLATAAGLVVVAAAIFLTHIPSTFQKSKQTAGQITPTQPGPQKPPVAQNSQSLQASVANPAPVKAPAPAPAPAPVTAKLHAQSPVPSRIKNLAPSPSENASTTLTQAELSVPDMSLAGNSRVDASLRDNLRTLNEFIAECEKHLKQNPQDQLAREYLYSAYQQKADLLAAMMDSGRSDH
jgi:hypothetical protein